MKTIGTINDKQLLDILADVKNEIRKIFGDKLRHLILFGSYARNEHAPDSDIDIMILVEESEERLRHYKYIVADIMGELSLKHEKLISLIEIPYNRYARYLDVLPFYKNVYDEGVEIYGRESA
jgi:predicted nucleotidyltransferase